MARRTLSAKRRRKLPASAFAYPKTRKYPIDTKARARNALARAAQSNTSGTYQHVAKAVRRKHGNAITSVGTKKGVLHRAGTRKGGKRPRYRK
jgi:Tfp pilus assembly protein PilX